MKYKVTATKTVEIEAISPEEANRLFQDNFDIEYFEIKVEDITNHLTLNQVIDEDLEDFVEQYRRLFPPNIKTSGYPVRGDKKGCQKKMKMFLKNYPEYNQEHVLKATRNYINEMKYKGYQCMMLAHNFIKKDDVSMLASFCENLGEKGGDKTGGEVSI